MNFGYKPELVSARPRLALFEGGNVKDVFITAQLTILPEDLRRLRAIDTERTAFIDACIALLNTETRVHYADERLVEALWGQPPDDRHAKKSVSEKQRLLDKLAQMSGLDAEQFSGLFRDCEDGIILFMDDEPELRVHLICDDERVRGERNLAVWAMHIQQKEVVLKGQNGEDPDINDPNGEDPFYFAVIFNFNQRGSDAVVCIAQGDDGLVACDKALGYLRPNEEN